jgi:uncharacterized iron-regulated membrane protein
MVRGLVGAAARATLYRAVWRWHAYAGLFLLPLLAWMAATGALYLYKDGIERTLYRPWIEVPAITAPLPARELIDRVEAQVHGRVTQIVRPASPNESWRLTYDAPEGGERMAFVRADVGLVLGTSRVGGPMETLKELHSLAFFGPVANALTEIAAGWAIILVLSGFYLWWPRAGERALSLAGRVGARRFWRNLHASTGAIAGAVILFLALTGMPWTQLWGGAFHDFVAATRSGRPAAPGAAGQGGHRHDGPLPWTLRGAPEPMVGARGDVGLDRAMAAATAGALEPPYALDLPQGPDRPYRLTALTGQTAKIRVLYVDPASGHVLQDVRYADFGMGAKAFEWGIATHQGGQYGEPNRLVMLAGCIGMLLLAASAPVMWWKRRCGVASDAPSPEDDRRARGLALLMLVLGFCFPLTGATMAVAWLVERIGVRLKPNR